MEWASLVSKQAWSRPVDVHEIFEKLEKLEKLDPKESLEDEVDCWGKARASKYRKYFKLKPC